MNTPLEQQHEKLGIGRPDQLLPNVDHIIIHTSATRVPTTVDAADIDRWHRGKGWFGNGYHFVLPWHILGVQEFATGHRCRPLHRAGAHVGECGPGWNARSIGICLVGGLDEEGEPANNYTASQWWHLERLVPGLIRQYPGITTVLGHRDLIQITKAPPKECPVFEVEEWWRTWVMSRPQNADLVGVKTISDIV